MAERFHEYTPDPEIIDIPSGLADDDLQQPPSYIETTTVTAKPDLITYANEEPELPENVETYHLSQGVPPFPLSTETKRILRKAFSKILETNRYFDPKEALQIADDYVRRRFTIGEDPYIFWSSGGSDEILERFELLLSDDPNEPKPPFYVVGPSFQNPYNFIRRRRVPNSLEKQNIGWQRHEKRGLTEPGAEESSAKLQELRLNSERQIDEKYGLHVIEVPLHKNMNQTLQKASQIAQLSERQSILSVSNPTSPTGWVYKYSNIESIAEICAERGHFFHVDEAAEVGLADSESAIRLTENYPNVIVTRSFSKIGLPLLRTGFAVMSPNIGTKYENLRRPHDLDLKFGLLTELLRKEDQDNDDEIAPITTIISDVREKTREIKEVLVLELLTKNVQHLPTSEETLLITIDGEDEGFYEKVLEKGIEVVPGESFRITHSEMSNRYVRMVIPPRVKDVPNVVERLLEAKKTS